MNTDSVKGHSAENIFVSKGKTPAFVGFGRVSLADTSF